MVVLLYYVAAVVFFFLAGKFAIEFLHEWSINQNMSALKWAVIAFGNGILLSAFGAAEYAVTLFR